MSSDSVQVDNSFCTGDPTKIEPCDCPYWGEWEAGVCDCATSTRAYTRKCEKNNQDNPVIVQLKFKFVINYCTTLIFTLLSNPARCGF